MVRERLRQVRKQACKGVRLHEQVRRKGRHFGIRFRHQVGLGQQQARVIDIRLFFFVQQRFVQFVVERFGLRQIKCGKLQQFEVIAVIFARAWLQKGQSP